VNIVNCHVGQFGDEVVSNLVTEDAVKLFDLEKQDDFD
jgi:hypothetical protein